MTRTSEIQRFTFYERAVHWLAALSFAYAALTGLALWSPRLFWLAAVFGGGETVRSWHPWGGVVFAVILGCMFLSWAKQMRLDGDDRAWLRKAHRYAVNDEEGLPEAGRFNAGQKVLFWLQAIATLLLFVSGIVLWFPEHLSQGSRLAAILAHSVSAVVSVAAIIVHIYMGIAAVPGALRAMVRGRVSSGWAASHHPKWYRDQAPGQRQSRE
jgi:formate dehydrogenase subunit gamma